MPLYPAWTSVTVCIVSSCRLLEKLEHLGASVAYHGPYVPTIRPAREHAQWAGTESVAWDQATISGLDVVLIATAHAFANCAKLAGWARCSVKARKAKTGIAVAPGKVWKA